MICVQKYLGVMGSDDCNLFWKEGIQKQKLMYG